MALKKPVVLETTLADLWSNFQTADTLDVDGSATFNESGGDKDFRIEGDTATSLVFVDASIDAFQVGTTVAGALIDARSTAVVFNEPGDDRDFRVESDTSTHALVVDAGLNAVLIGTATPGGDIADFRANQIIFNNNNADQDFRVEGTTATTLFICDAGSNAVFIGQTATGETAQFRSTFIVFNENGGDIDFRVEGDTATNLFVCDAGTDRVTMGTTTAGQIAVFSSTFIQFNSLSNDIDFFVNGDTATALFRCDAGLDAVLIGTTLQGAIATFAPQGSVFNEQQGDLDFRVEGDSLSHMLFLDATDSTENIALLAGSAPNWQTMDGGIFLAAASTAPTGNPTAGVFIWVTGDSLNARNSAGTVRDLMTETFDGTAGTTDRAIIVADGTGGGTLAGATALVEANGQLVLNMSAEMESPTLGAELLDSTGWTTTDWTGSFAAGWDHTTGNVTALLNSLAATIGGRYEISFTVSGRTAGTFTVGFGGQTSIAYSATNTFAPTATTVGSLIVTPTSTFDGAIIFSIKEITGERTPFAIVRDTNGLQGVEMRGGDSTLFNFALGENAGESLTTGARNVFIGTNCGSKITTGDLNLCIGDNSGAALTTGDRNICIGSSAGQQATNPSNLLCIGTAAGFSITTGTNNTLIGTNSGTAITTAVGNTALGVNSLIAISTGSNCVAIGNSAAPLQTGGNSVAIGAGAGGVITTGTNNVFVGHAAVGGAASHSNCVIIGQNIASTQTGQVILGNASVTATTLRGAITGYTAFDTAFVFNEPGADIDFRAEGDTLTHMLFLDGSASTENIALLASSAPNWQSMDGGLFIANGTTIPSGNPSGGGFLYVEGGALKWRGSGGTITTVGPA